MNKTLTEIVLGIEAEKRNKITELIEAEKRNKITELIEAEKRNKITELIEAEKRNKITELKEAVDSGSYQVRSKVLLRSLVAGHLRELSLLEGRRHLCLRDVRRRNFLRTFIRVSSN